MWKKVLLIKINLYKIWIKKLINEIFNINIRIIIMVDNKLCSKIAKNENKKVWCKYMGIKYKYIFDEIIKKKKKKKNKKIILIKK